MCVSVHVYEVIVIAPDLRAHGLQELRIFTSKVIRVRKDFVRRWICTRICHDGVSLVKVSSVITTTSAAATACVVTHG